MEFDFAHLKQPHNRQAVLRIALLGELFPFVLGFAFGQSSAAQIFPQGNALGYSLFCGTAFSITALPILGRIMLELNLHRSEVGTLAISAAAINDVAGWLLLAVVSALAVARFSMEEFALKVGLLAVYVGVCWWVVRPVLAKWIRHRTQGEVLPLDLLGVLLACAFVSGMATYKIGIFAIFGGFMMGVLLHDQRELAAAWREKVGHFVNVFFVPIFFTYTGLRTGIGLLDGWQMWGNTRALMELVVINVGYDLGVIPRSVFTMLVLMALVSTIITTPALKRWLGVRAMDELKQGGAA